MRSRKKAVQTHRTFGLKSATPVGVQESRARGCRAQGLPVHWKGGWWVNDPPYPFAWRRPATPGLTMPRAVSGTPTGTFEHDNGLVDGSASRG